MAWGHFPVPHHMIRGVTRQEGEGRRSSGSDLMTFRLINYTFEAFLTKFLNFFKGISRPEILLLIKLCHLKTPFCDFRANLLHHISYLEMSGRERGH